MGFGHESDPSPAISPESQEFSWVSVESNEKGDWELARISESVLPRIRGTARHPDYVLVPLPSVSQSPETLVQLREKKYVFQLGDPAIVRGVVRTESMEPIANAEVLVGERSLTTSRRASSGQDGSFVVTGCQPGNTLLTATAHGFAPATLNIEAGGDSTAYQILLKPGHDLKMRVVDQNGVPIPQAGVSFQTSERAANLERTIRPVQASFAARTDAEGRIHWAEAPASELSFTITAQGFKRTTDVNVVADGIEHDVTLPRGLTITGTVRDATTGQPVDRFKLTKGWTGAVLMPDQRRLTLHWSPLDRDILQYTGGKFEQTYNENPLDSAGRSFVFKVEADGYAPFVTREVKSSEERVDFDVRLQRADKVTLTFLDPDQSPAAGAKIVFGLPQQRIQIINGSIGHRPDYSVRVADARGQFEWTRDDQVETILAASTHGFARVPAQGSSTIQLQSWARLEGTLLRRGQPATASRLFLFPQFDPNSALISMADGFAVDGKGKFTVPKAPPGHYQLSHRFPLGNPHSSISLPLPDVSLTAGETARFDYNDTGRAIVATLKWPEGAKRNSGHNVMCTVRADVYPPELRDQSEALLEWSKRPEAKAKFAGVRMQQMQEINGRWVTEGLKPGPYLLSAFIGETIGSGPNSKGIAQISHPFTIPDDNRIEEIDLGEIKFWSMDERVAKIEK